MSTSPRTLSALASILLAASVATGCASGPKPPSPELQQRIAAARTPADHESLAAHYDFEAAKARATAEEHRKLAQLYRGQPMGGRGGSMSNHCNAVVGMYENIANEYGRMAAEHRNLAK